MIFKNLSWMAHTALPFFTWTFTYVQLDLTSGLTAVATGGGLSIFRCVLEFLHMADVHHLKWGGSWRWRWFKLEAVVLLIPPRPSSKKYKLSFTKEGRLWWCLYQGKLWNLDIIWRLSLHFTCCLWDYFSKPKWITSHEVILILTL